MNICVLISQRFCRMRINISTPLQINPNMNNIGFKTNNKNCVNNDIIRSNLSLANLGPMYIANIAFGRVVRDGSTNVELIEQMKRIMTKKNFNQEDINKLFLQMTPKVQENVKGVIKRFEKHGLTIDKYLIACIKQNKLFYLFPEKVVQNVEELVMKFNEDGLTTEKYLEACIKHPQLFCQDPRTIERNIRGVAKRFEKEGLTIKRYLEACLNQSALFAQLPETIERNVRGFVERFEKEGLTTEKYLGACVKKSQLFYQSPETIEHNVRGVVARFEKEGLTTENYLGACIKQPPLLCVLPATVENNLRELVGMFAKEGLTIEKYIEACLKRPPLFYRNPESIAEHINAYKFCSLYKNINSKVPDIVSSKNLTYSTSLIYLQEIIKSQIVKQSLELGNLTNCGIKPKLKRYFKLHPNSSFYIKIPNTPMASDFINTMQEWCKTDLNRDDVFNYVLVGKFYL